jgi:hypothetical protein
MLSHAEFRRAPRALWGLRGLSLRQIRAGRVENRGAERLPAFLMYSHEAEPAGMYMPSNKAKTARILRATSGE